MFLLELGAGFFFVAYQKRFQSDGGISISVFRSKTASCGAWSQSI